MSLIWKHYNAIYKEKLNNNTDCNSADYSPPTDMELYRQCQKEFKKRKFLQILKMDYEQNKIFKDIKKIEDATKEQLLKYRAEKRLDLYIFLTVNPPDGKVSPEELLKMCIRAMSRKFIGKYHFVIEQRGKTIDEAGKGMHAHLLFQRNINYKPAVIKRDLKNTFKKCFNNINDSNFNFKKCGKEFYEARLTYIQGGKTGPEKDVKMEVDQYFRKKFNLENIYEN